MVTERSDKTAIRLHHPQNLATRAILIFPIQPSENLIFFSLIDKAKCSDCVRHRPSTLKLRIFGLENLLNIKCP